MATKRIQIRENLSLAGPTSSPTS